MTSADESVREGFRQLDAIARENAGEALRGKIALQAGDWRRNRDAHPGLLVMPGPNRRALAGLTVRWTVAFLQEVAAVPVGDRVTWLRGLVWRHDACILPLAPELASAVASALETAGFLRPDADAPAVKDGGALPCVAGDPDCVALACSLLRAAREARDPGRFAVLEATLRASAGDRDVPSHLAHERVLLHLGRLEHGMAAAALRGWVEPLGDPIWAVRKSALAVGWCPDLISGVPHIHDEHGNLLRNLLLFPRHHFRSWNRNCGHLRVTSRNDRSVCSFPSIDLRFDGLLVCSHEYLQWH